MKLRIVLLLLTLPPMIAFATLGAYLCVQSWTKMSVAKESANIAETAEEISALVHNLQVERGMSAGYLASGGVNFAGELEGKRQSTDYAATDLKNKSAKLTAMFGDGWGELVQKLGGLGDIRQSVNGLALKPAQAGFEYTQIISGLLSLQAEKLATTTDPTLLHYGAGMLGIDYAKEAAGLERAAGATGLGADSFPPQVYDKFTALSVRQEATLQVAGQSLGDFELYDRLMMTDEAMAVFAYRKAIRSYASGNGAPPVASEWFAASTEWVNRLRQEGLSVSSILVQTANKVEQNAIWVFSLTIGSAVTLTIGCLGLTIFYSRRLSGQIGELRAAMARLAEKDFDVFVPLYKGRSELAEMSKALYEFKQDFKKNAKKARESLYKSFAYDGSSSAMMIVDRDFRLIDSNQASHRLMEEMAPGFKEIWPDFDPSQLLGQQIDKFHKNPEHQRKLLSDPSGLPFEKDIEIGDRKFVFNISGVFDEAGEYVGNILQWDHVTVERKQQGILKAVSDQQGIATYDLHGRIKAANSNFCAILSTSKSDIVNMERDEFLDTGFEDSIDTSPLFQRLRAGEAVAILETFQNMSGQRKWVQSNYTPIVDGNGVIFEIVQFATDVTEAKEKEHRIQSEQDETRLAQAKVVERLAQGLNALADADLTARLNEALGDNYDGLRADFNSALSQLEQAIVMIAGSVEDISGRSTEMKSAAFDLSKRTEGQAATLEETAAALDQLTAAVQSSLEGTRRAKEIVTRTRDSATNSGKVVSSAVTAMGEIASSSEEITKIISVIEDIAFQTNLLALNAGVEAARAGETGRGFAVVASEVRALAQRASDAAGEINKLIITSSQHVKTGVDLVGEAGHALEAIAGQVVEVSEIVETISVSAEEQSVGLAEINSAVNVLDQATQHNAAMVEETTAASDELVAQTDALSSMLARFTLDTQHSSTAKPSSVASSPPVQMPAAKAPAAMPVVSGNTALKAEESPALDDGWEDF